MEGNPNRYTIKLDKSTKEQTDIYEINWTVPKFGNLLKTNLIAKGFRTPRCTVVKVPDTPFQLKLCLFGIETKLMEISFQSSTSSFIKSSLNVDCTDSNLHEDFLHDYKIVQVNSWQSIASLNELNKLVFNSYSNRQLNLVFTFTVSQDVRIVAQNIPQPFPQQSEDLGNLLVDAGHTEVTMKSAEGIEFRAHKNVLAARSEVLKAHFEHNMKENITNVVETQWETDVLKNVLTFVYTDKVPQVDAPDKLLAAADYYQLMGLKSLCVEALYNKLTVENAIDTLQIAELYSSNSLTQSTLEFIKNGRAQLAIKTQGWANIQSVKVLKSMYECIIAGDTNNVDILAAALDEYEFYSKH